MKSIKLVAWWVLKTISGVSVFLGVMFVAISSADIFLLLTGRVEPGFDQPNIAAAAWGLIIGLVLVIGGHQAPKWLDIDRLR